MEVEAYGGNILSRFWNMVFRRREEEEDYEKKLQHLSMEESLVHAKLKKRAQRWRITARNIVVLTFACEVIAMIYAIATTSSVGLNWKIRAVRVLPIFAIPCLFFVIYTTLGYFTKLIDRNDEETVENLREKRQAKINELKEITNYYTTHQLIQRYDADPKAKAAAATVLASKLEADTGMKISIIDDSMPKVAPLTDDVHPSLLNIDSTENEELELDEQHRNSGGMSQGWLPRLAAMLVGEDPTQCYAIICQNCLVHNGLCRKEDYSYITYYCSHCRQFNGPQQLSEDQNHFSRSISAKTQFNTKSTMVQKHTGLVQEELHLD